MNNVKRLVEWKTVRDIIAFRSGSEFASWNPLSNSQHRITPLCHPSSLWDLLSCFVPMSPCAEAGDSGSCHRDGHLSLFSMLSASQISKHTTATLSVVFTYHAAEACLRSSPLALTLYQRRSHLPRAGTQGVRLPKASRPPPGCHPYPLCEWITHTSPWRSQAWCT